jgi:hypothetical protein
MILLQMVDGALAHAADPASRKLAAKRAFEITMDGLRSRA